ncbi:MAG TPA: hypothetical protein VLC46_26585 [Thermoanaerobaculia bacterium]|jgi:hypothetical protein|nr:hypothetical protein [Thermoanaerobaculia bacterium]
MPLARMALIGVASLALGVVAEARTPSGAMDVVLPAPHQRPAAVGAEALRPAPQFDGCGSTPISCDTEVRAQLAPGDCLSSNGALFDEYVFSGNAQDLVTATVRPLVASYTNAWAGFVVPPSSTALAPLISGGPAATVRYALSVTGTWRLQVGTNDRIAVGDYLLDMACDFSAPPSPQTACIEQELLCGQQATWELSSVSCIASSDPNRFYSMYRVYGVGGDTLMIRLTSSAFDPQFAVYELAQSSTPLAQSSALNATTDTLNFPVPHNGFYDIAVTTGNAHGIGQYVLALDCNSSGCLTPIITKQPEDVTVPPLSSALLSVEVTALGDVDYEWFSATGAQTNVGGGSRFGTPPVTGPLDYYVTATTPCGTVQSRIVHVQPAVVQPPPPPPRHRAVRH